MHTDSLHNIIVNQIEHYK